MNQLRYEPSFTGRQFLEARDAGTAGPLVAAFAASYSDTLNNDEAAVATVLGIVRSVLGDQAMSQDDFRTLLDRLRVLTVLLGIAMPESRSYVDKLEVVFVVRRQAQQRLDAEVASGALVGKYAESVVNFFKKVDDLVLKCLRNLLVVKFTKEQRGGGDAGRAPAQDVPGQG